MYQQDQKEQEDTASSSGDKDRETNPQNHHKNSISAQTPMSPPPSQRSQINAHENDPSQSLHTINYRNCFSGTTAITQSTTTTAAAASTVPPRFPTTHQRTVAADDTWCRGSVFGGDEYGTTGAASLGTPAGDVSLTLGLRHAGNLPEKGRLSLRDFGAC